MTVLDTRACRLWVTLALRRLESLAPVLDALNVFPVPDGDTGTNLLLTLRRAVEQAEALDVRTTGVAELSEALALGALLGARGNSGMITAQVLRGCAEAFAGTGAEVDGVTLARALVRADELAWESVATPVEGTVLSATREVAAALRGCRERDALAVARTADRAARRALALTTSQLADLSRAGVVDAGAAGLVVLLDALVAALGGQGLGDPADLAAPSDPEPAPADGAPDAFEVMLTVRVEADLQAESQRLRTVLAALGDSVVVAHAGDALRAHVHTADPAGLARAVRGVCTVDDLAVTPLVEDDRHPEVRPGAGRSGTGGPSRLGCVAWTSAPGLAAVIASAGARPLLCASTGPRRVSTEELLAAVLATARSQVLVLPNDAASVPVARAAARDAQALGVQVEVVATTSEVQGLAALAVLDLDADLAVAAAAMGVAAAGCRAADVVVATRDGETPAGPCTAGDHLVLLDGQIRCVTTDLTQAAAAAVTSLGARGADDLVTVVVGEGICDTAAAALRAELGVRGTEVQLLHGGQSDRALLIGVE